MSNHGKKVVPVFFAIDEGYSKYLCVCLRSLMDNADTKGYKYDIHILNSGLSEENRKIISNLNNDKKSFEIYFDDMTEAYEKIQQSLPIRDYYSPITYFRFFIADYFPQYDKAVYIDADTIVLQSIHKLYKIKLLNNYVAASPCRVISQTPLFCEYTKKALGIEPNHYFSAGVMLMNTKLMRAQKIHKEFVELANYYSFRVAQDQDYLNVLCKGRVRYIGPEYNCETFKTIPCEEKDIIVLHYCLGKKPWNDKNMPLGHYFWDYAIKTPYYTELKKEYDACTNDTDDSVDSITNLANQDINDENNYWQSTRLKQLSDYRKLVLDRIKDLESRNIYDIDVEDDPESKVLMPDKIDYLRRGLFNKFKVWFSYRLAESYLNKAIKKKDIIIDGVEGQEYIDNLDSGALITCNHFSALDSFVIQYAQMGTKNKRNNFYRIIKEGNYTSFPGFYGFLMRNCNTLPLSSNMETMKKFFEGVKVILEKKGLIVIYPEQSMWYNYRKPRPLKKGGFTIASKYNVPVVPCFITMEDSENLDAEGYPIQKYFLHIMPPIYPKKEYNYRQNIDYLLKENEKAWKDCYERVYNEKL